MNTHQNKHVKVYWHILAGVTMAVMMAWTARTAQASPSDVSKILETVRQDTIGKNVGERWSLNSLAISPNWTAVGEADNDYFSYSLASAGDVNGDGYADIIVGAYQNAGGGIARGKAYVFLGSAGGIRSSTNWTATGMSNSDYFGRSVAGAGDVNGDGYDDVIVGAPYAAGGGNQRGKAYVFLGSASGVLSATNWTAVGESNMNYFGMSVAGAGDVNGDGYADVIVGAGHTARPNAGKAFVFLGSASGVQSATTWVAVGEGGDGTFGISVAGAGDVNGDNYADVVVGAPYSGTSASGKAYVFLGSSSGVQSAPNWTAVGEANYNYFGNPVAGAGDVNGDGYADVIVGAYGNAGGGTQRGKAYVFLGSSTGVQVAPNWTAGGEADNDYFGKPVAGAGDVDGDNYGDVIVGASGYDGAGISRGKAYVFLGSTNGVEGAAEWTAVGEADANYFGSAAAGAGDVNGDGYADVLVGAYYYDGAGTDRGKAYCYQWEVVKSNQTITFPSIPDQLTTNTVGLSATASSGLPVTNFNVLSGPGVLSGLTNLTFTNAGSVRITADQPGNVYWNPAPTATNTFAVTKATASVTLSNLNQTYDGAPRVVTASSVPSGLSILITYNGSTSAPVNAGSYAVTGTVSDAMYQGAGTGTLAVSKIDQTLTFLPIPDQLTTNTVGLSAAASSGLPVTNFNVFSGPGVLSGLTNLTFTNAGSVRITADQPGNVNWNPAPAATNTFAVTKATASVTLSNLNQVYDGSQRVVTASSVPSGLSVLLTYDGSASAPVNAGSYAVTGTVSDAMYQGTNAGTLTVSKADQTITFPNPGDQSIANTVPLNAIASSELPVSLAVVTGPGVIADGTNLTFTGVGYVSIAAAQAGNTNWNAAEDITNTFRVLTATNYYVRPNGNNTNNGTANDAVHAWRTIQHAVTNVAPGDIVHVAPGTYTEQVIIAQRLTLTGAGSGDDPAFNTHLSNPGGAGISLTAGGASEAQPLVVSSMRIANMTYGFHVFNSFISHVTIDDVTVANGTHGMYIDGDTAAPYAAAAVSNLVITNSTFRNNTGYGLGISDKATVDGLTVVGSHIDGGAYGIYAGCSTTNWITTLSNVRILDTTVTNISNKGMYLEKLSQAVFSNILVDSCGTTADAWPAGIDIDLKWRAFENIRVFHSTFRNCGTFNPSNGFGLAVKARDDGTTYGATPAILTNLTIIGCYFAGCATGLRLGEPGQSNAGPANVTVSRCSFSGNSTNGLRNETRTVVDARTNWWGHMTGPTNNMLNPAGHGERVTWLVTNVDFSPWLGDGANTQPGTWGFYPNLIPLYGIPSRLVFTNQPANAQAGVPFASQPVVAARDDYGNTGINFTGDVTLAIGANPGGGALSGTNPRPATNGMAAFTNLAIDKMGLGYTLVASGGGFASVTSAIFNVDKADQVITFPTIPDQVATNTVSLSATASSGLPVSFTVGSGPAQIAGLTNMTFTGAGVVSIVAGQAGDADWNPAPAKTNAFYVGKAAARVTLASLSQTYNGAQRVVTASSVPSGLTVLLTYDGSATPPINAGSYAVIGTINDAIYTGTTNGTLVVARANQAITFAAIPDQFTTSQVALAATASSGLPVTFAVVSGPAQILTGNVLTFTGEGMVTVAAAQLGDANWNAAPPVANTFNVMRATVPIVGIPNADFDGDGLADPATYDENTGNWKIMISGSSYATMNLPGLLGGPGWMAGVGDYDGDGLADPAVFQDTTGDWILMKSGSGYAQLHVYALLGAPGWAPDSANFTGDRVWEFTAYQEATGNWTFKLGGMVGALEIYKYNLIGGPGYSPVSADFDGDGFADPAVYNRTDGTWKLLLSGAGYFPLTLSRFLGGTGWNAVPGDYDGDGLADPAVRKADGSVWRIMLSGSSYALISVPLGL